MVAIKILLLSFRIVLVTLAMLYVNFALNATYSFNFSPSVFGVHVTFDGIFVIRFEITLTAIETLLVEMDSICVICHRLGSGGLEFTYIASHYL